MTHAVDVAQLVQIAGAILYVLLGAWVLTLTPRRLQTKLLGAFAVLSGLGWGSWNLVRVVHPDGSGFIVWMPLIVLSYAALFALAWSVPRPLADRRLLGGALTLASVFLALNVFDFLTTPSNWGYGLGFLGAFFHDGAFALLALRAGFEDELEADDVRQLAILGVGIGAIAFFTDGVRIPLIAEAVAIGETIQIVNAARPPVYGILMAGLWWWNMLEADGDTVAIHRAAMLSLLGVIALGALYKASFPAVEVGDNAMRGVMRTLGVGLLAYGILRHDLAGLDAKVEWGVSKTTVAGIFVAVFFVAGEFAETFFGGVFGPYAGVIAAGALVFALSPLQRMADRFAAKAVPGGAEAGAGVEHRYRDAIETALADGEITIDEERHLARLAERLGIDADRAFELREQVEDERSPAGGGGDA